jgi:hypothetical protein
MVLEMWVRYTVVNEFLIGNPQLQKVLWIIHLLRLSHASFRLAR